MSFFSRNTIITGAVVLIFISAFLWWIFATPSYDVIERVPGQDNRPPQRQISDSIIIGEFIDTLGIPEEILPGSLMACLHPGKEAHR